MKKSIVELFTYAAAASFFALPPYGLAAHWYGVVLLAVSVLPAVGMSLLLTKFCRSGIPAAVRFARSRPAGSRSLSQTGIWPAAEPPPERSG